MKYWNRIRRFIAGQAGAGPTVGLALLMFVIATALAVNIVRTL